MDHHPQFGFPISAFQNASSGKLLYGGDALGRRAFQNCDSGMECTGKGSTNDTR